MCVLPSTKSIVDHLSARRLSFTLDFIQFVQAEDIDEFMPGQNQAVRPWAQRLPDFGVIGMLLRPLTFYLSVLVGINKEHRVQAPTMMVVLIQASREFRI